MTKGFQARIEHSHALTRLVVEETHQGLDLKGFYAKDKTRLYKIDGISVAE
jgi:hypothetical protein